MKKQGLKLTGKVLTGLVLLSGVTAFPTRAIDVKPAAVDVNVKNVKANVFEKDGRFYAKLVADKEVANVVARITTETKAQFLIKRDIIKAGEEVVVELDLAAQVPTRKLPHTGVKKESFNTVTELAGHTFKISVSYEVATDEVKAQQKANNDLKNRIREEKNEEQTNVPSISDLKKDQNAKVEQPKPSAPATETKKPAEQSKPAETAKPAEQPKTADTEKPAETPKTSETVAKPNTPEGTKPSVNPMSLVATPVATAPVTPVKTVMTNTPKTVAPKDVAKVDPKKVETPTTPMVGTREEQIRSAFIKKLNELRGNNKLRLLSENAALNTATANRAAYVANNGEVHAGVHGVGTNLEKEAARNAGFPGANNILYNVVQVGDSGTSDEVAYKLLKELFTEANNVTKDHPYGHRNTLLSNTSSLVGVGVKIVNGKVFLVQHQNNTGVYNGATPISGVFLDGKTYIK